jgi:hypothetical protein
MSEIELPFSKRESVMTRKLVGSFQVSVLLSTVVMAVVQASDWPQFRGPGGLGIAADKGLPTAFSATENVGWKRDLPGAGSSGPIVVGDKIFVTCYSGYGVPGSEGEMADLKRHLVCLDRAGKILWKKDVAAEGRETTYQGFQALHGYASSTPASDGKAVFVFFGKAGVFAFDFDGNQLWKASIGERLDGWGSATSPVLTKDHVIINASVESGALIALKKSDGEVAWRAPGMSRTWGTPLLVDLKGRQELVVSVQVRVLAFDPLTGKQRWSCEGIRDYVCPSVIAHDGIIYAIGSRANAAMAIRAGGAGDVSESHVVWRQTRGSNVTSPVYHEGYLYWASESKGMFYCVNAKDGKIVYEERLRPNSERIYASPVLADGKIYVVSRTNGVFVIDAKPEFKLLAHNTLGDKSVFNASPAVVDGQLLLRSDKALYCFGTKR